MQPSLLLFCILIAGLSLSCKLGNQRSEPPPDLFHPPVFYSVGGGPTSIGAADFNNDGSPDLITCNIQTNDLSVLVSNGDGTFQNAIHTRVKGQPRMLAVSELTGDSNSDVAVIDGMNAHLIILAGKGDGTFEEFFRRDLERTPSYIVTADFTNDGLADIAVSQMLDHILVFSRNEDGPFKLSYDFDPGDTPTGMAVVDMNQDGNLDLIIANSGEVGRSIAVFYGNGDGTFKLNASYETPLVPLIVETDDFTGDGILDIVTIYGERNTLGFYPGLPEGGFGKPIHFGAEGGPSDLVIGDFDRDGKRDLAVSNNLSHKLSILLGKGNGEFDWPPVNYHAATVPFSITTAEFIKGKPPGLAVANNGTDSVAVFLAKEVPSKEASTSTSGKK